MLSKRRFSICRRRGNESLTSLRRLAVISGLVVLTSFSAFASETNQFLGAQSCSSSSCHGGADAKSNQNLIWSQHDPHAKSFATLISARSERIAESLNITNAAKSARCTVCHAPFATVPPELAATVLDPAEGVSCESCHGMAKTWLRSHTRKDLSHTDKVASGMRELRNLYDRANTCVACHQNVDADILAAGHPELIFELDGQSVSEHKHWQEQTSWSGAQTWLVGQAVALREVSWQKRCDETKGKPTVMGDGTIVQTTEPTNSQSVLDLDRERWFGLAVLFTNLEDAVPGLKDASVFFATSRFGPADHHIADGQARSVTELTWAPKLTAACLARLAGGSSYFRKPGSQIDKARYAERLVLALDRLLAAQHQHNKNANAALDKIFKLAQSRPDFDPGQFADALDDFAKTLK